MQMDVLTGMRRSWLQNTFIPLLLGPDRGPYTEWESGQLSGAVLAPVVCVGRI